MLSVILAVTAAACFVFMCIALSVAFRLADRCDRLEAELERRDRLHIPSWVANGHLKGGGRISR